MDIGHTRKSTLQAHQSTYSTRLYTQGGTHEADEFNNLVILDTIQYKTLFYIHLYVKLLDTYIFRFYAVFRGGTVAFSLIPNLCQIEHCRPTLITAKRRC